MFVVVCGGVCVFASSWDSAGRQQILGNSLSAVAAPCDQLRLLFLLTYAGFFPLRVCVCLWVYVSYVCVCVCACVGVSSFLLFFTHIHKSIMWLWVTFFARFSPRSLFVLFDSLYLISFLFSLSRLHWLFAYRFYAVAKFSLGTAWARVSACLPAAAAAAVCCCLLLLRIYASCLRLFNQLFSLTRVCLARSRSLFNYSCTALAALGKFVIL